MKISSLPSVVFIILTIVVATLGSVSYSSSARAVEIRVNFEHNVTAADNESTTAPTAWNNVAINAPDTFSLAGFFDNLNDYTTGTATTVDLDVIGYSEPNNNAASSFAQDWVTTPSTTGWLRDEDPSTPGIFTFDEMPTGTNYKVEVVLVGSDFAKLPTFPGPPDDRITATVNGATADISADGITTGLNLWDGRDDGTLASDWLIWNSVALGGTGSDEITLMLSNFDTTENLEVGIAAIRITEAAAPPAAGTPEPSTFVLALLSLLSFAFRRRRVRRG